MVEAPSGYDNLIQPPVSKLYPDHWRLSVALPRRGDVIISVQRSVLIDRVPFRLARLQNGPNAGQLL